MEAIITALTTAFAAISDNVFDVAAVAIPVAAGIAGLFIAVKLGFKFFRQLGK